VNNNTKQKNTIGYNSLFYNALIANLIIDPETGNIFDANKVACSFYGYEYNELTKKNIADINIIPKKELNHKLELAKQSTLNHCFFKHKLANGKIKDVEVFSTNVIINNKNYLYSTIIDITNELKIRKKLERNEQTFRALIDEAPDIIILIDKKGIIKYVNSAAKKHTGYSKKEIIGTSIEKYIPKEDIQLALEKMQLVFNKHENVTFESCLISKNGNKMPFLSNGKLFIYNDEQVDMVVLRDITDRIKSEEINKKNEARLKNAEKIAKFGNWELNLTTNKLFWSDQIFEIFGISKSEFSATSEGFFKIVHPDDREFVYNEYKNAITSKTHYNIEHRLLLKTGEIKYVHEKGLTIYDTDGKPLKTIGTVQDITEYKLALNRLEERKETYKNLFEKSQDATLIIYNNKIVNCNEKAVILFDATNKYDLINKTPQELSPKFQSNGGVSNKKAKQYINIALKNGYHRFEWDHISLKGKKIEVEVSLTQINLYGKSMLYSVCHDISSQKIAQKKLTETTNIIEKSKSVIFLWKNDENWDVDFVTKNVARIYGYSANDFITKNILYTQIIHPEDLLRVKTEINTAIINNKNTIIHKPYRIIKKNGDIRWISDLSQIRKNNNSKTIYFEGIITDITTQIKYDAEIKKLTKAIEITPQSIGITDLFGKIEYVNSGLLIQGGFSSKSELIGKSVFDFTTTESLKTLKSTVFSTLLNGGNWLGELILKKKDNTTYIAEMICSVIKDEKNNPIQMLTHFNDITERKKNENELNKFRTAIYRSDVVSVITDLDGNIEFVNPAFTKVTGYTFEEVIGKNPRILNAGQLPKSYYKTMWETIQSGKVWKGEFINIKKNGEVFYESVVISPILNTNNEIVSYFAQKIDITTQKKTMQIAEKSTKEIYLQNTILKQTKEELIEKTRTLNNVVDGSKAIIVEIDANYNIIRWNKSAVEITGILYSKIQGKNLRDLKIIKSIKNIFLNLVATCLAGDSIKDYEILILSIERKHHVILLSANPKYDLMDNIIGVLLVAQDITELTNYRKKLELKVNERTLKLKKALEKEQELSELKSQFVSVVSHEFRTPLSAINFSASFIKNSFTKLSEEQIKAKLEKIETQVFHMTRLLDDVITMGKTQSNSFSTKPKLVNCNQYFKNIIEEVTNSRNNTHKVIYSQNKPDAVMYIDENQGRNIFINLLSNAIKFSPNKNFVEMFVESHSDFTKIFVKDYGIGIENTTEIFKPFLRGKNASNIQGTGLGLSIVLEAIKKHNGKIHVQTKLNEGSTFEVILPL